jgi:hypothetical protein
VKPIDHFYLSFCDDSGFLGACVVQAFDMFSAVTAAHLHGCNPGGEVMGVPCQEPPPNWKLNTLYSRAEMEALDGVPPRKWKDTEP